MPDTPAEVADDIQSGRVVRRNDLSAGDGGGGGGYVLYWMQSAQRTRCNHALEHALDRAEELDKPLAVCFGLTNDYPEANARHYAFLLQGLRDVAANLEGRGIAFVCDRGDPADVALKYAEKAAWVVSDVGYTRPARQWAARVAEGVEVAFEQVESEAVVPVRVASDKREFAARTLRPKIHKVLDEFLVPLKPREVRHKPVKLPEGVDVSNPEKLLAKLGVDGGVSKSPIFHGGEEAAQVTLDAFLSHRAEGYADRRNEPASDHHSYMSMYLHYGHVSPSGLALAVKEAVRGKDRESFLEELIVRRELSKNFVWYTPDDYDAYTCLPDWAQKTLEEHAADDRPVRYTRKQLEQAQTDDSYWNAAMDQMRLTGFMHNYMRMYWGKKVLEWGGGPKKAFETLLYLNNTYFLDGRDPNSYANVAWVFGLHDRPWGERPIFGKVRYMNMAGLDRKYDMAAYVAQIDRLRERYA